MRASITSELVFQDCRIPKDSAPGVSAVILFTLSGILGLAILRISSEFVRDRKNNS